MAKSLRSKVKRSYRAKKRADGVYAATEAARLQRLNAKLLALSTNDRGSTEEVSGDDGDDEVMPGECCIKPARLEDCHWMPYNDFIAFLRLHSIQMSDIRH